ncbi:B3 domain-containing protein At1g05920-like [Corylus avellana]|uniref:B3 domain-containing protein At1g05920-like n=1 Tax=Corylus avellana TaxID=13451 RepID=UPI00286B0D04|nr:B3 domain-containing protein At1g05920-like [Corylus avellana]
MACLEVAKDQPIQPILTFIFSFYSCLFLCSEDIEDMTIITLEDLRRDSLEICGDFNKIKEEVIRAVGGDQNEVDRLLTVRILMGLDEFYKKRKRYQEKKPLESRKSRKPKKQRKNLTEIKHPVPTQMPTEFKDKIAGLQGLNIKLVIQKELTITDMNPSQDRFSIPRGQMRFDFLSNEDQARLKEKEANGKHFKGKKVPLIEPGLKESSVFLKKWKFGNSSSYVLSNPWMDIAKRNGLKPGNNVQLWSFKVNQKLCLALINLDN